MMIMMMMMKLFFLSFVLFEVEVAGSIINGQMLDVSESSKIFSVLDFGAKGDGKTKDTVAIQNTLNAAAGKGGTVYFPSEKIYLTGSLTIFSHTTLFIDANATLLGSQDRDDFPMIPALPSYGEVRNS